MKLIKSLGLVALAVVVLIVIFQVNPTIDKNPATVSDADSLEQVMNEPEAQPQPEPQIVDPYSVPGYSVVTNVEGEGSEAKVGDTVTLDYTGALKDGTVFDSSVGNEPFTYTVGIGQVIPGFDAAVLGAKKGQSITVTIPSVLAYGAQGAAPVIPPNATLTFEIEIIEIASPA